jgi:hypothetical protein
MILKSGHRSSEKIMLQPEIQSGTIALQQLNSQRFDMCERSDRVI